RLLECASADEFVHLHVAALPDAEGAVGGLILDGRIPPAVKVENVVRARQVQPGAAGLDGEHEKPRPPPIGLEASNHAMPLSGAGAPMEEQHLAPKRRLQR